MNFLKIFLLFCMFNYCALLYAANQEVSNLDNSQLDSLDEDEYNDPNEVILIDPLEKFNRATFSFLLWSDKVVVNPVDISYKFITPRDIRMMFINFFNNLNEPLYFLNNIVQFKFVSASRTVIRFFLNSTLGFLGSNDVAQYLDLPLKENYLQDTFFFYYIDDNYFFFIPFIGSYNLTELTAFFLEGFVFSDIYGAFIPFTYWAYLGTMVTKYSLIYLENRDEFNSLMNGSVDKYGLLKSVYAQSKEQQRATTPRFLDQVKGLFIYKKIAN